MSTQGHTDAAVIGTSNSQVNLDELMQRVAEVADRIRSARKNPGQVGAMQLHSPALMYAVHRHTFISSLLDDVQQRNEPRSTVPPRLERLRFLPGKLKRFSLRIFNYLFKGQRELNAVLIHALRELISMQYVVGTNLLEVSEIVKTRESFRRADLAELEGIRNDVAQMRTLLEGMLTLRSEFDAFRAELGLAATQGLIDRVEFAHRRITDGEAALVEVTQRLGHLTERAGFLSRRIDDGEQAAHELRRVLHEYERLLNETRHTTLDGLSDRVAQLLEPYARKLDSKIEESADRLARADAFLRSDLIDLRRSGFGPIASPTASSSARSDRDSSLDALYVALEDNFRGTELDVRKRLEFYVDVVSRRDQEAAVLPVLDVGCGRGELLSVLGAAGVDAVGIDQNAIAVEVAETRGLQVSHQDFREAFAEYTEGSFGALTSLHVVEHLELDVLLELLRGAYRIVAPGGIVAMETPNPENILVGSCTFYLDPTHRRPVPAGLLQFLAEFCGFIDVQIVPLHEPDVEFPTGSEVERHVRHYFYGARDYALIARRP